MISVLNSISNLVAENALTSTHASLQNTLTQLSTGLKINSGADDPAGLSIANGLGANISALTQSSQNASNGIGLLQTADGALAQVTTLLNQAITIATEAANGGLSGTQSTAANTEFQAILSEINQIGSTTNFNGTNVFTGNTTNSFTSTQASLLLTSALTPSSVTTITDAQTGGTFVYTTPVGGATVAGLQTAINNAVTAGTLSAGTSLAIVGGQVVIKTTTGGDSLQVSSNDAVLGAFNPTTVANNSATVFTSDGTASGTHTLTTTINSLSATSLLLNTNTLTNSTNAAAALTAISNALTSVSANRGSIGAAVNQLTADTNVENTEVTNLTSAQNNVQNADIATTVAKMTQYNVLEQTGMAALSQSNQAQQAVLKLLQ
jgi:flagellin